jgi:hypothetical protein
MWGRSALCFVTTLAMGQALVATAPVVAVAASEAVAPTAAVSTDTWGPVQKFERNTWGESLVVDAAGVTTVVWSSTKTWPYTIKAAQRTAAGAWKTPVTIGRGTWPVVAADDSGTVTVAWVRDRTDRTTGVWASRKRVGKPWSTPVHLSADKAAPGYPDGGDVRGATDVEIAVHRKGATVVTWVWSNRTPSKIQAVFRPAGGPWRKAVDLTPAANATNPHAAFAPTGRAWVAFNRTPLDGPTAVKVRYRLLTGTWTPSTWVGRGELGGLGISRYSEVTVAFRSAGAVRTALWSPVAGWQAPTLATPVDARVREWAFASNRRGAALVVYTRPNNRVDAVRRTNGGAWLLPVTLADPGHNSLPTAAMNRRGDQFAAWGTYGVWAAYRPAGGRWHATTTVLPDTGGVDVLENTASQVAPNGDAMLLWAQEARRLKVSVMAPGDSG